MTISLKNSSIIIRVHEIEMNVVIMTDMIIEDIDREKKKEIEIDSIDNIGIIEIIAGIAKGIETIGTTETEIDKEKDKDKEIGIEIEIDIIKIIKAEMHKCHLHLILAICPIIVIVLIVRLGIHDSPLYECLWTSWRTIPIWF